MTTVIFRVLLFWEYLGCLKTLLSTRIHELHWSLWKGHTHIYNHTRACMNICRFQSVRQQVHQEPQSHEPSRHATNTYIRKHTLTEGVRAICGPSHASPMQRCLLAVGVIIGHAGLFLCQGSPCQETITEHSDDWLAQQQHTWKGIMYGHIHHKKGTAQALPPNDRCIHIS